VGPPPWQTSSNLIKMQSPFVHVYKWVTHKSLTHKTLGKQPRSFNKIARPKRNKSTWRLRCWILYFYIHSFKIRSPSQYITPTICKLKMALWSSLTEKLGTLCDFMLLPWDVTRHWLAVSYRCFGTNSLPIYTA